MKLIDVKPDLYAEYDVDSNEKNPKFQVGDQVRTSKYKTFLVKDILRIDQKKFQQLAKLKIQFHGFMLLMI